MTSTRDTGADHEPATQGAAEYFASDAPVHIAGRGKILASRICFPLLALLSREWSLRLGLTPIDDERVIMALRHARGRVLDVGCGSNLFVRSYGDGIGVDVMRWKGCDLVIDDPGRLPFADASFDTVTFLACLNHIANRERAVEEARRVLRPGGQILLTMIPPRLGTFIHWLRARNDPDHIRRHFDRADELMGMSAGHVRRILFDAGFRHVRRRRFVFGLNSLYIADRE